MRATLPILGLLTAIASATPMGASAEDFARLLQKQCTSTSQTECQVKAGRFICDRTGKVCQQFEDHAGARFIRLSGRRVLVDTRLGEGYVAIDSLMVSDPNPSE